MSLYDRRPPTEESDIDITPMMDIVFIMLIFFIVTASFVKEEGIDVNRPDSAPSEVSAEENILVQISDSGQIWIDGRVVDPILLRSLIEQKHAENPDGSVVISADDKSKNKLLVTVMDAARMAGVYEISLAAN